MSDHDADGAGPDSIRLFLDKLADVLPSGEVGELVAYRQRIAGSPDRGDSRYARECAQWARRLAALPDHDVLHRIADRFEEWAREIEEAERARRMSGWIGEKRETSVEVSWIDEAVRVAQEVAAKVGWDAVGWRELLDHMTAEAAANE